MIYKKYIFGKDITYQYGRFPVDSMRMSVTEIAIKIKAYIYFNSIDVSVMYVFVELIFLIIITVMTSFSTRVLCRFHATFHADLWQP